MPIPFTKPDGLLGRFAVVKPWPDVQAAEDENIARLQITARSMGLECIVVDPEGVWLDHPEKRINWRDVDFVIHLHFETPKAYDAFSFVALWNPLRFFKDWGYRHYSKNLLTHDDFLSCSSTWADHHVKRMIAEDPTRLAPHFTMYHSLSEPIFEPSLGHGKIFYAGINWDKLGKKKGRHQDLLLMLDKAGVMRIHGPRIFNNVNVWEGYECYVGPVPFDGVSMIKAISEAGIALVFSSDAHKESELMSNRLFESLAAGAVIICDDNPFARKFFGDTLLYVDASDSLEKVNKQILSHYAWIQKHPQEALGMARAAQDIFKAKFTLDRSLATLYTELTGRKQQLAALRAPAQPAQEVCAILTMPEYAHETLESLLGSVETQSHAAIKPLLLVDAGDQKKHGREIQARLAKSSRPVEVKTVTFYERRRDGSLRRRPPLGKVLAPVIEALPVDSLFTVVTPNESCFSDHVTDLLHALQAKPEHDFAYATSIVRHVNKGRPMYDLLEEMNVAKNENLPPGFGRFLFRRSAVTAEHLDLMNFLDMRALSPLLVRTKGVATTRPTVLVRLHEPFVTGEFLDDVLEQQIVVDRFSEMVLPEGLGHVQTSLAHPGLVTSLQTAQQLTFHSHLLQLQATEGADALAPRTLRQLRKLLLYELFHHEANLVEAEQAAAHLPRPVIADANSEVTANEKCDTLLAYWVGLHHEAARRPLEALRAFSRALQNIPNGYASHYTARTAVKVARLSMELGQENVAVQVINNIILKIQPSNPAAREMLTKLNPKTASAEVAAPAASAAVAPAPAPVPVPTPAKESAAPVPAKAKAPVVSAIVSAYKSERFLRACLEDLEAQTIADELEIIVVDSNSPQNERAIVEEFQKRYSNIVYIRTDERETVYGAWNRGIKAARGKYVTNANTDDRHQKNAFEVLSRTLDQHPDVTLVYADCLVTDTENDSVDKPKVTGQFKWLDFNAQDLLVKGCFVGPQPMWRRDVHDEHGYFDAEMVSAGDYEFWLRLAQNRKFLHVKQMLGLYLNSPTSVEHANRAIGAKEVETAQNRYKAVILNVKPFTPATAQPAAKRKADAKTVEAPEVVQVGNLRAAREAFGRKEYAKAWTTALAAVTARPFHPEGFLFLAEIALVAGDSTSARACAQHARELTPNWPAPRNFLQKPLKGSSRPEWLKLPEFAKNATPRLSVCVIAKNEEKFLGQCLKSVHGFASQIIVVDTGSTDRTVEIAREHGAEIHTFAWNDDFSAARNAALEHATGDWILMLDADEELPVTEHAKLLADMRKAGAIAHRIPLVNQGQEAEGASFIPRLYCNVPGAHYYGRIHEQVFPSLLSFCKSWGLETLLGTAQLVHHGYTKELVQDRNKVERNLKLLRLAVEERPDDVNLVMNLGLELVRSGELNTGLFHYREAFRMMSALPPRDVVPELREVLLTQITSHLYSAQIHEEVVRILNSPLAKNGGLTASLHFALGLSCFQLGQNVEAAEQMRQCLAKRHQPGLSPINLDIKTVAPHHCLALALAKLNDVAGAEKAFAAGVAEDGKSEGLQLDYAHFLTALKRPVEALQCLHAVVQQNPANATAWRNGGQIALSNSEFLEFARDWAGEAIKALPDDAVLQTQRAEALLLGQDTGAALPLWEAACRVERSPKNVAAAIVCAIAEHLPAPSPVNNAEEMAASRAFVEWYRQLLAAHAQDTIMRLNSRVDALRATLPTAAELLDNVVNAMEHAEAEPALSA